VRIQIRLLFWNEVNVASVENRAEIANCAQSISLAGIMGSKGIEGVER